MTDTEWTAAYVNLVRHANDRGERVSAYIQGVTSPVHVVEATNQYGVLDLTGPDGSVFSIASPTCVVLRWLKPS